MNNPNKNGNFACIAELNSIIMKYLFTSLLLGLMGTCAAQSSFPDFLQGTWKVEAEELYEHWDKPNTQHLKGFSYSIKDGQLAVSEYLDITQKGKDIIYMATVLNQNQGKGIEFLLTSSDSVFIFENLNHDFPQKISYRKLADSAIFVQVSGENRKGFSYQMKKLYPTSTQENSGVNPNYDRSLAEKLGADDYGMKPYLFVILKTGTNQTKDQAFINEKFRGHMENINQLVAQKKLILAGPFDQNERNYRGLFILNQVATVEEAKTLLQTDPAIGAGLLDVELYPWYGSAALPTYLEFSDRIWKTKP